jgi:hypothetical protein
MGIFDFFKKKEKIIKTEIPERNSFDKHYFEEINMNNLKDYYYTSIEFNGRKIDLDLNFETKNTNQNELDRIDRFINQISVFNKGNKIHIKNDFELEVSMTFDYLNFFLDELEEDELGKIIDLNDFKESRDILLLKKLELNRVGIYPQHSYFATFDYSIDIDGEPCNQLLVVNVDEKGKLDNITWES